MTTASLAIPGSRRGVRTATAVGAVTLGLTALTACEKPTPLTTVTVGRTTVTTEAACYHEGKTIPEAEAAKCTEKKPEKTISVGDGDKLRIGVEPDMAETGWMIFAGTEPLMQEPSKKTYHSFPGDTLFQQQQDPNTGQPMPARKSVTLRLILVEDGKFKGVWIVKAKRDA